MWQWLWTSLSSLIWLIFASKLLKAVWHLLQFCAIRFVYPRIGWTADLSQYESMWTVGTGVTDGIGKAYLTELAERGLKKFILIGRNQRKLDDLKNNLIKKFKAVEVKCLVMDFKTKNDNEYETLAKSLEPYQSEIGILINAAGISVPYPDRYIDQERNLAEDIFRINSLSVLKMTDMVIRGMKDRRKGLIVNMGSMFGYRPLPNTSSYSASKAFVSFYTECLAHEMRDSGVHLQCLTPNLISTKMINNAPPNGVTCIDVQQYAREAVDCLGTNYLVSGCWANEIQVALMRLIPFSFTRKLFPFIAQKQAEGFGMSSAKAK